MPEGLIDDLKHFNLLFIYLLIINRLLSYINIVIFSTYNG